MTKPTRLELAKQGDEAAIISVMNYLLKDKGITAKAAQKDDCLLVVLKSAQVPEQKSSVAFIKNMMMKLGVPSIKSVKVYGKQTSQQSPAWEECIDLTHKVEALSKPISSSDSLLQAKPKAINDRWPFFFPYPISWFRALILVPFAFPGARLIVLGLGGMILSAFTNNPGIFILFAILGLLIPTFILSLIYYCFGFILKKQSFSERAKKWLPDLRCLWEGFYGTFVIGFSFLLILSIALVLAFLQCKLSVDAGESISRCIGRVTGSVAGAIFGSTDNVWDFSGRGVITREQDSFAVRPWFIIWLIVSSYLYQAEYLTRHNLIPKLQVALQNHQSVRNVSRPKPQKLAIKLMMFLLMLLVATGAYWLSKLPGIQDIFPVPIASQTSTPAPSTSATPMPSPTTSETPTPSPQSDPFREAVNAAISAATLTQSAQSQDDWSTVAAQWQKAITLMKGVPASSPNYTVAQKKVSEYQLNLDYAQKAANRAQ